MKPLRTDEEYRALLHRMAKKLKRSSKGDLAHWVAIEWTYRIFEREFKASKQPEMDAADAAIKREHDKFAFWATKWLDESRNDTLKLIRELRAAPATAADRARAAKAEKRLQRRAQIHAFLDAQTLSDTSVLAGLLRKAFPKLKTTTALAEVRAWKKERKKDLQLRATEKSQCRNVPQKRGLSS